MKEVYKPVGFFRAFFHLMAGMFLAIFVPLTSILNELQSRATSEVSSWSFQLLWYLTMVGTGVALLATAFGAAPWKMYVRRTAYVLFAVLVIVAAGTR